MRDDILVALVHASRNGETERVQSLARALAWEARETACLGFAQRIEGILGKPADVSEAQGALDHVDVPGALLPSCGLSGASLQRMQEILDSFHRASLLRSRNLEPVDKILLVTTDDEASRKIAGALAHDLFSPLLIADCESWQRKGQNPAAHLLDAIRAAQGGRNKMPKAEQSVLLLRNCDALCAPRAPAGFLSILDSWFPLRPLVAIAESTKELDPGFLRRFPAVWPVEPRQPDRAASRHARSTRSIASSAFPFDERCSERPS